MGFYEQLKPLYIASLKFGFARFFYHSCTINLFMRDKHK